MAALDYSADLDDIRFVLFDQLDIDQELTKIPKWAEFDRDTYEVTLQEAARLATDVLAPVNVRGDRQGCTLDANGNVKTPEGFAEAWRLAASGGWFAVSAPAEVGGTGLPLTVAMATTEMFAGAAMAFWMYPGLTGAAARVIFRHGPAGRRVEYAERMFTGVWGGTMCLTESGAGSDVGENRCKAVPAEGEPDVYLLEGEKIFISCGDSDFAENILHLVLARTPDSPPGTKGLSLFLVPKFLIEPDLSNGERNGVYVVGLEEKMGIHGSATCTIALGDRGPCRGWLVGEEHQGIRIMFEMMNEARIGVGAQGVAIAGAAYRYALAYARERVQGSAVESFRDPAAPRVPILAHPDVRRMLMTMKVQAEASRAMLYRLAYRHDIAENNPELREKFLGRVELLVPVLKAHCSDLGFEMATLGVQVLGGYGYTGEYPLEQLVRDSKIATIYEGTNGIQAMDLLGRKMQQGGGKLFMQYVQDAQAACEAGGKAGFAAEAEAIGKALGMLGATAMHLGGVASGNLRGAFLQAYPFLKMFGIVHLAIECLDQARVAQQVIAASGETPLLRGKALNLRFYVANILPGAVALAKSIQAGDESCLDESCF